MRCAASRLLATEHRRRIDPDGPAAGPGAGQERHTDQQSWDPHKGDWVNRADVEEKAHDELKDDVGDLKMDLVGLNTKTDDLSGKFDELSRHMHVLHEDTIARIRAMDSTDLLRAEMRAGFAEVLQKLGITPFRAKRRTVSSRARWTTTNAASRRSKNEANDHGGRQDLLVPRLGARLSRGLL